MCKIYRKFSENNHSIHEIDLKIANTLGYDQNIISIYSTCFEMREKGKARKSPFEVRWVYILRNCLIFLISVIAKNVATLVA